MSITTRSVNFGIELTYEEMSAVTIRQFIRMILAEKHTFTDNLFSQLKNVEPIPSGDHPDGLIGSGAVGDVIEVLWKKKHAVVKLFVSEQEHQSLLRVKELKSHVPNVIGKHLPTIYDIQEVQAKNVYGHEFKGYAAIMEYLKPIPRGLRGLVFASGDTHRDEGEFSVNQIWYARLDEIEKNERKFLNEIKKIVLDKFRPSEDAEWYIENFLTGLIPLLRTIENPSFIVRRVTKFCNTHLKPVFENNVSNYFDTVGMIIRIIFKSKEQFPIGGYETHGRKEPDFKDKRVTAFYKALKYLQNNGYVEWDDLHADNVMVRPADGALVACDVGFFKWLTD